MAEEELPPITSSPQIERLTRLEERVRSLGRSVDDLKNSLPAQFLRVETKVEDAARHDRIEWSQLIDRQRDQFLTVLKEDQERRKDDERVRQSAFEKSEMQNSLSRQKVDKLWMAVILIGIIITLLTQIVPLLKLLVPALPVR